MRARTVSGPLGFGLISLALAVLAAGALLALARSANPLAARWALVGWAIMSAIGIAGGTSLVRLHGRTANGFFVVLSGAILARLALAALGAWGAASTGAQAVVPYLAGLAAGYLPLQVLEVGWMVRRSRAVA
jgi:hypothetical protein